MLFISLGSFDSSFCICVDGLDAGLVCRLECILSICCILTHFCNSCCNLSLSSLNLLRSQHLIVVRKSKTKFSFVNLSLQIGNILIVGILHVFVALDSSLCLGQLITQCLDGSLCLSPSLIQCLNLRIHIDLDVDFNFLVSQYRLTRRSSNSKVFQFDDCRLHRLSSLYLEREDDAIGASNLFIAG